MKKKILFILLIGFCFLALASCSKKENNEVLSDALKFKEEYEKLNGAKNSSNKEHRTLSISEDNPFVYATSKDIVDMVDNKGTFYVYFGSSYCPWCRSVMEEFIKVAKEQNIAKVYYVDIWDGDHVEILRDTYTLDKNNKLVLSKEGGEYYQDILQRFDNVLSDYTLTDSKGKTVKVGEKRIFAPNFIYVEEGVAKKITEGISSKQKDSREELTEEILKDENKMFKEFFED